MASNESKSGEQLPAMGAGAPAATSGVGPVEQRGPGAPNAPEPRPNSPQAVPDPLPNRSAREAEQTSRPATGTDQSQSAASMVGGPSRDPSAFNPQTGPGQNRPAVEPLPRPTAQATAFSAGGPGGREVAPIVQHGGRPEEQPDPVSLMRRLEAVEQDLRDRDTREGMLRRENDELRARLQQLTGSPAGVLGNPTQQPLAFTAPGQENGLLRAGDPMRMSDIQRLQLLQDQQEVIRQQTEDALLAGPIKCVVSLDHMQKTVGGNSVEECQAKFMKYFGIRAIMDPNKQMSVSMLPADGGEPQPLQSDPTPLPPPPPLIPPSGPSPQQQPAR